MINNKQTMVRVSKETAARMIKLKGFNTSYDDLINMALEVYEKASCTPVLKECN
jgi:hypothetical protein